MAFRTDSPRRIPLPVGVLMVLLLAAAIRSPLAAQGTTSTQGVEPVGMGSDFPERAVGASLGSLTGYIGGALLVRAAGPDDIGDVLLGGLIGSAVLAPLGAHVFDEEPGSLTASLVATVALTALTLSSGPGETTLVIVLPVGQILTAALFGRGPG